jgi:hypothetical protein
MEHYKKSKILSFAAVWMELEDVMLSEIKSGTSTTLSHLCMEAEKNVDFIEVERIVFTTGWGGVREEGEMEGVENWNQNTRQEG